MTQKEIAAKWKVDRRTVNRWQKKDAPLHDDAAMAQWLEEQHSRSFVGKYSHRHSKPIVAIKEPHSREVVAEVLPVEYATPLPVAHNAASDGPDAAIDDPGAPASTLARLEEAERIAYRRYADSGGSDRAAQIWLLVCDQKRKLIADQAQQASDISEAETKFISDCWQVVWELFENLKSSPALLGVICEGLERDAIQAKCEDHIQRTINGAAQDLASIMRGTSLEIMLPEHARSKPSVTLS